MKGCLYYDAIEKIWYVNWLNIPEMYPSVAVGGRLKLHPDDVNLFEFNQKYIGKNESLVDKEVEYTTLDGYAKLVEIGYEYYPILYSKIENLIIKWSNDGTKTAGTLTREIIDIITN
jgi:hypothetical protein